MTTFFSSLQIYNCMKTPPLLSKILFALFLQPCLYLSVHAQIWSYTDDPAGNPATHDPNSWGYQMFRTNGATIPTTPCQLGYSSTNFSNTTVFSTSLAAVEFYVQAATSYRATVTSISAGLRRSGNGPASIRFAYSLDNGSTWVTQGTNQTPFNGTCGSVTTGTWDMPDFSSTSMIKFRIYGFNALTTGGTQQLMQIKVFGSVVLADADGDGYYDDVDCNDNDAGISPGAFETCNGSDEDCNGSNDNIPVKIFADPYGGDAAGQYLAGIKMLDDGTVMVAGTTYATSGDIPISHGGSDIFLMKLGVDGSILWVKTYGGPFDEGVSDFIQTSDGGFALAGSTRSGTGDVSGYHGGTDLWVVKTDVDGNIQWQKAMGGASDEDATKILEAPGAGYLVVGNTSSTDGDVSGNHGSTDIWVTKLNSNGIMQWAKALGGSGNDFYSAELAYAPDGGCFVASQCTSTDGDATGNHGNGDLLMVKLDVNGNKVWSRMFGSPSAGGYEPEVVVNPDGSCIAATYESGNGGDVSGVHGGSDIWVFKIDGAGNLIWQKALGGSKYEYFSHLQATPDGNFLISSDAESTDGDVTDHTIDLFINPFCFSCNQDLWIVKMDGNGNVIWTKSVGKSGSSDGASAKAYFDDDRYLISWNASFDGQLGIVSLTSGGIEEWRRYQSIYTSNNFPAQLYYRTYSDGNTNGKYAVGVSVYGAYYDELFDVFATVIRTKPLQMWQDQDGDGYGSTDGMQTTTCGDLLPGFALNNLDCNNSDSTIHPGAPDVCNGIDDNCDNVIDENAFTASVSPSGSVTICKGTTLILTASGGTGITYQWLKDAANINGATSQTYSLTKAAAYAVKETNAFNCTSTSAPTTVIVKTLPTASITPLGDLNICATGSVVLQAVTNNGTSFQWQKGSNLLAGATNQNYTATAKGTYKVNITNNSGCSKLSTGVAVTKSCRLDEAKEMQAFSVYPNPAGDQTTLQFSVQQKSTVNISLFDMSGRIVEVVLNEMLDEGEQVMTLHTALLARGMYTIRMISGEGLQIQKLMLQ